MMRLSNLIEQLLLEQELEARSETDEIGAMFYPIVDATICGCASCSDQGLTISVTEEEGFISIYGGSEIDICANVEIFDPECFDKLKTLIKKWQACSSWCRN